MLAQDAGNIVVGDCNCTQHFTFMFALKVNKLLLPPYCYLSNIYGCQFYELGLGNFSNSSCYQLGVSHNYGMYKIYGSPLLKPPPQK